MNDDLYGEKLSFEKKVENEKRGEYADIWENASMENVEFKGVDPYKPLPEGAVGYNEKGEPVDAEGNVIEVSEKDEIVDADRIETKNSVEQGYNGAEKLTSYGLDTASRIYGLGSVLKAVVETDESDRDALNPMGSIYSRLVPNPDERKYLYNEIQKDSVKDDKTEDNSRDKLKIDAEGNFFAVNSKEENVSTEDEIASRETNTAVREMKKLLNALLYSERFSGLRDKAASQGMDVISYVTAGDVKPTLSKFFDGLDSASSDGGSVEEILDEIEEEEKAVEAEETASKIENNEAVTREEVDNLNEINPEMLR